MGFILIGQTFVKTIPRPLGAKRKYFTSKQESAKKDVDILSILFEFKILVNV